MGKKILIIQGHPDSARKHLCHALADAYEGGALAAGNQVEMLHVAKLSFPLLRCQEDWTDGAVPEALQDAEASIKAADHLVFFYPLWLGGMPALLKGFLEQVLRPPKKDDPAYDQLAIRKAFRGKSARIVVTMGMPGFFYRLYYRAHTLRSFERNILAFVGVSPVRSTIIGLVEGMKKSRFNRLTRRMHALGRAVR